MCENTITFSLALTIHLYYREVCVLYTSVLVVHVQSGRCVFVVAALLATAPGPGHIVFQ